jgi:hypothetical protein
VLLGSDAAGLAVLVDRWLHAALAPEERDGVDAAARAKPDLSRPVALSDHPRSVLERLVGPGWTLRRVPARGGAWALMDLRRDSPGADDAVGSELASRVEALTAAPAGTGATSSWVRIDPVGLEAASPSGVLFTGPLASLRRIESATLTLDEPGGRLVSGRLELRFAGEGATAEPR